MRQPNFGFYITVYLLLGVLFEVKKGASCMETHPSAWDVVSAVKPFVEFS